MSKLLHEPFDIIITGVGGQGNVLASHILGNALVDAGWQVTVGETYGLSQRGGSVMSMVRITSEKPSGPMIPENGAHAIVSLEPLEALRVAGVYGNPETVIITNSRPMMPINVISGENKYPAMDQLRGALDALGGKLYWLDATEEAMKIGAPILANVIILGAMVQAGIMPLSARTGGTGHRRDVPRGQDARQPQGPGQGHGNGRRLAAGIIKKIRRCFQAGASALLFLGGECG